MSIRRIVLTMVVNKVLNKRFSSVKAPILMASLWLSACNILQPIPEQNTQAPQNPSEPTKAESVASETAITKNTIARPDVELTQDILYQLLLAEIAGQRGKLDISVENYLQLAQKTRDPKVIERAARIAVYARDDQAAAQAAELWFDVDPRSTDARQILAVMAIRNGDVDRAVNHLEDIIENGEGAFDQKLWMIANMLGREENEKSVIQVMERLMEKRQSDPKALFAYANVVTRLGDLEKAEDLLLKVIELEPTNESALITYVSLLQKQEKTTQAITWLEQELTKQPESFNLQLVHARLLADAQRFDEAQKIFEKLDTTHPENIDVVNALAYLHLQANRLKEAKPYFIRLTKFSVKADEAGYYLGRIAQEEKNYKEAETWYGGVQKGQHYFDSQIRIGILKAEQGKIKESRNHFQSIPTSSKQEQSIVVQAEAEMLIDKKLNQQAMKVYGEAIEQEYDADLLYARAMLAEKMGRLDVLEADLKQILENDPDNSQALNALGYTLADRTERYQEAYEYIKRAYDISSKDFFILDSMGWVLYRLGRLDEAIDYLQQAMALRPDPEIAAHLGEVLWVKGDKEGARKVWDTALKETPEDTKLLNVIKRFTN